MIGPGLPGGSEQLALSPVQGRARDSAALVLGGCVPGSEWCLVSGVLGLDAGGLKGLLQGPVRRLLGFLPRLR